MPNADLRSETGEDGVDSSYGLLVGLVGRCQARQGRGDDQSAVEQLVHSHDNVREDHDRVGDVDRARRAAGQPFEKARGVIAEVADRTTPEPREPGQRGHAFTGHRRLHGCEWVVRRASGLPPCAGGPGFLPVIAQAPGAQGTGPQKGVAGPLFAAHDGFEQEPKRRTRQFRETAHRGLDVERDFPVYGNEIRVSGQNPKSRPIGNDTVSAQGSSRHSR
jgi:hypothetical protein